MTACSCHPCLRALGTGAWNGVFAGVVVPCSALLARACGPCAPFVVPSLCQLSDGDATVGEYCGVAEMRDGTGAYSRSSSSRWQSGPYTYTYTYTYIYIYIYIYIRNIHRVTDTSEQIKNSGSKPDTHIHIQLSLHIYIYIYTYVDTDKYRYTYTYIYMHTCARTRAHRHTHTHTHTHTFRGEDMCKERRC